MSVLVACAVATWAMVGLVWRVQLVHYPMLATWSAQAPVHAMVDHQRRITWLVGPLMATEGVTTLALLAVRPASMSPLSAWAAAALLGVALMSTVLVQVPLHRRLAERHDVATARRLVASNWIRTAAWTSKGLVLAAVLAG